MARVMMRVWLAAFFWTLGLGPVLAQPAWISLDIGGLPGGGGEAMDVNDSGEIVGYSYGSRVVTTPTHAFLWTRADGIRDLGTLGGRASQAYGINNTRQVVGYAETTAGQLHAFLWTSSAGMIDLGALGGTFSQATAINRHGEVIGSWATSDTSSYRPFRWTAATGMVDLTIAMGVTGYTFLHDINDSGQIVGADDNGAFLWTPGGGRTNLPGASTLRLAINNRSQVAGTRATTNRPFVWTAAGGFADVAASTVAFAQAIDDSGLVALAYYPFGSGAGTGVAVSSVGGPFSPLSTATGDWRGLLRAISLAGVVGRTESGPYFWCRGGAPTISGVAAVPSVLQPANAQLVTVQVDYAAAGRCGRTTNFLEVESSEPDTGNVDGLPDFIVVDPHTVRLRAEALPSSSGRTYTIRIRSSDDYGYSATQTLAVTVPAGGGGGGGGAMTGVTLTTSVPSPQASGTSIVLSASGSGGAPPYAYRFWSHAWTTGAWRILCDWSTTSTCVWRPTIADGHDLVVEARRSAATSGVEAQAAASFEITSSTGSGGGPMTGVVLSTSVAAPQPVGTAVALSANGTGGTAPYAYRFWIQPWATGAWQIVQDWSTVSAFAWTPTAAGGYNVAVEARSGGGTAAEVQSIRTFEITTGGSSGSGAMTGVALETSVPSPQPLDTGIILTASGSGGAQPYSYRFWVQPWATGAWQVVRDWSPTSRHAWVPTSVGGYNLAVEARSAGSSNTEVQSTITFNITGGVSNAAAMTNVALTQSPAGPQTVGTVVTWTAAGSGGATPYSYRFWVQPWGGAWQVVRDWNVASSWTWQPLTGGGYNVAVEARSSGAVASQVQASDVFVVTVP